MNINVDTKVYRDLIDQSTKYGLDSDYLEMGKSVARRIINLQEQGVKDALKSLGWLSPEEAKQLRHDLETSNNHRDDRNE